VIGRNIKGGSMGNTKKSEGYIGNLGGAEIRQISREGFFLTKATGTGSGRLKEKRGAW